VDTPSPALMDAFGLLREDLYVHLEEASYLADDDEWSPEDMDRARQLIRDLVFVVRGLLVEHRTQEGGHDCTICSAPWPCPVVNTIHTVVKDPQRQFYALVERVHENG